MSAGARLGRDFYDRPVLEVAHDLVGAALRHGETVGRIVETEAYHQSEPACHAYAGVTKRTGTLFGPPGVAYVYRSYGIHALLNAVCEHEDVGAAVLIRALEPVAGIERMVERRGSAQLDGLCSGPGKLTQALAVEVDLDATSLIDGPIELFACAGTPRIVSGERIGITKAAELPWRFCDADSVHVSRPWPAEMRRRAA